MNNILNNVSKSFQSSSPARHNVVVDNLLEPKDIALALQGSSSSPTQQTCLEDVTSTSTASGVKDILSQGIYFQIF